jgi:aspartate/methionine/tyrosine aminotransferase
MTAETAIARRSFQPFEYMAWAKQVRPGAAYPFNVSGLPAPDPSLDLGSLAWGDCLGPSRTLLDAFIEKLAGLLGVPGSAGVVVSGASEAITVAFAPFVQAGQPVIVENPAYRAMERSAALLGGVPVHIERREDEGWRLDPERLDALLRQTGAKLIGITDPHNPTGVSVDTATRAELVRTVERHGALLVVDELFSFFRGPERPPLWAAGSDHVLSLGSMTKGWGLSSLRCGWVLGSPQLVEPCAQAFDLLTVNPPTATLTLALRALDHTRQLDEYALRAAEQVRQTLAATEWGEASMVSPQDGIIAYLKLPRGWTSEQAVSVLRERHGIQAVPGHFFGHDDHLRVGFAGDGYDPAEGCRLLASCLNRT